MLYIKSIYNYHMGPLIECFCRIPTTGKNPPAFQRETFALRFPEHLKVNLAGLPPDFENILLGVMYLQILLFLLFLQQFYHNFLVNFRLLVLFQLP